MTRSYLCRLTPINFAPFSLSLDALHAEPALIREESDFVAGELTALCFREYRTFIMVHKCSSDVHTAFSSFTSSLDSLLDAVPSLEAQCQAFAASTKATQQDRSKAALVLEHLDRLQDLLEVPQLLETCVRNGYYHEALELGAHARQMERKYGDVAVVKDVGREVEKGLVGMLVQLLALLREPYKLPALVKAVGFLRRMDVLTEDELRVAFLTGREHNYRTQLVEIERERGDPVRYVRRYIDLFREHVYDIVAQFATIFVDGPSGSGPAAAPPPILNTFAQQAIAALVGLLRTLVPTIEDASALSSLLTQLNYCASSFARVGLDFRALVTEPFEQAVLATNLRGMRDGESAVEAAVRDALRSGKPPTAWMLPAESLAAVLDLDLGPAPFSPLTASAQTPPPFLALFPPLAQLCNTHTATLNSLRLFAPLAAFPSLVGQQATSLGRVASAILSYSQTAASDFTTTAAQAGSGGAGAGTGAGGRPGHRRNPSVSAGPSVQEQRDAKMVLRAFARAFLDGLVPFLRRGLVEGVFAGELGTVDEATLRLGLSLDDPLRELRDWVKTLEAEFQPADDDDDGEALSTRPPSLAAKSGPPSPLMEEPDDLDDEPPAGETDAADGSELDEQI